MQRLSIALAAIGLSASAFAAYPAATNPTEVSVPQLPGGLFIGVTGYYLEPTPTHGDLDYFVLLNSVIAPPFTAESKAVEPGYDWGWGANIGYIFPGTGNDLNLSYFHFDTDDSDSTQSFLTNGIITVTINDRAKAEYDIDQVDLTAGQYIDVGCRLILHPNVGLRFFDLERKLTENEFIVITDPPDVIDITFNDENKNDYTGIGPLAGIDASYYIAYGIGVVGHFDGGLLVGDIDDRSVGIESAVENGIFLGTASHTGKIDSTRRIVPFSDGKLGIDYTYVFNNTANSDLTFEVGYQVSHYFNVIDKTNPFADFHRTSDLGLHGAYASVILHV